MRGDEPPSLVVEDPDGREFVLSLGWDPRDPHSVDRPPGDFAGVLDVLDKRLPESESESPVILGAKVITLGLLDQPKERIADAVHRFLARVEDEQVELVRTLALSRLRVAEALGPSERGSAQALCDVASFYGSVRDPLTRFVAVRALEERVRALISMGDLDGVEVAWESVRVQYGAETHPAIRCRVAGAGWWAARGLLKAKRRADALRISEEVVGTYGSDTEADTRAHVVAVMYVRHSALRLRQVAARQRALDDLIHFVGSNPEPEVVEVIRAHKKADLLLRAAHDPD